MAEAWNITTLKEHFEKILEDRDKALQAALTDSQRAIDKAETRLNEILEGFPQEYGRKSEIEAIETAINLVRVDHVRRQEFADLKDVQAQGRGARLAISAGMGIVIALIAVALGAMYSNQLTNSDVSDQIARESPWATDKPAVEEDIHLLEQQVILLKTQLAAHEAADRIRAVSKK